nr:unnamed protein product [Callosobruchus analis]
MLTDRWLVQIPEAILLAEGTTEMMIGEIAAEMTGIEKTTETGAEETIETLGEDGIEVGIEIETKTAEETAGIEIDETERCST